MFDRISLNKEAVRVLSVVAVASQVVGYVATEAAGLNDAGQLSVIAVLGLISAAARKFVYSEETVDGFAKAAGLRSAEVDECGC